MHGQPAMFLIDTGASMHVLASWFVAAAKIDSKSSAGTARGSTGSETSLRVVKQLDGKFENGARLQLAETIVVEFPPIFAELKIAGLLSPQLLAPTGQAAVLDFRVPTLNFEEFETAIDRVGAQSLPDARVCIDKESEFKNRSYAIPITALGAKALVIVDSGATGTFIAAETQIARALESQALEGNRTQGVGGAVDENRHVPGVEILRGEVPVIVDLVIGKSPGPSCGPDGLLGMDALRQCLLVLGETGFGMTCSR